MMMVCLSLLLWAVIAVLGGRELRAVARQSRDHCAWAQTRQRNLSGETPIKADSQFKAIDDELRRSGIFLATGWRYCEAALLADAEFAEAVQSQWVQFTTRAVVGWLIIVGCSAIRGGVSDHSSMALEALVLAMPVISILALRRSLPDPWFGKGGLRPTAVVWLRAVLLDQAGDAQFTEVNRWRRLELRSGRCCQSARLQILQWHFSDHHRRAKEHLQQCGDWSPLLELVGIGIPVLWTIAMTFFADFAKAL